MLAEEWGFMAGIERTHVQVLQVLKENMGRYVSGISLASRLKLSRTSIWKHIRNLKALGYHLESHPKEGYKLLAAPDLLIAEEIVPHLATSWLARSYHHDMQIDSTNDQALRLAAQGAEHGTVVVAEEQTQGRGRLQRLWVSPAGCGIYLSMIFRTPFPVQEAPQPAMLVGLTLVKVLHEEYGLEAAIKWPNDVLLHGKKLAGILADMQSDQDYTRFLVVGIGINANYREHDFAEPFRYPATALALELGTPVNRQELLLAFLHRFEAEYDRFLKRGFGAILPEYERASAVLGRQLRIQSGKDEFSGKALGFTREGALRLQESDGQERVIWVGDVLRVEGGF
jgi:BirA family transcriptional regulator, biotin operon repressor / biotin---[acetyl-CoA-carboxylase] ligase